jgi:flagellar motor switch protein FliM
MNNVPKIVGAGKGKKTLYTYYNKEAGDVIPLPKKAARAAEVFAQQQAVDKMKFNALVMKPLIKSWEDRNASNQGTKLNP